ncbi:MAG: cytotoxic translational repressor of toxin-antitoxin stability system [Deltaproteobacteria bacterium]|nr:cytotoxic translational repressor of toxin-antitoxin stability system [Deltaproteobacteria bacterium]
MTWEIKLLNTAKKGFKNLPASTLESLQLLLFELEILGPVRGNWANYGKLSNNVHHCHLHKGRPTYVAVWKVFKQRKVIEVLYVGTHEKAHYNQMR